jgi:hypothetical protein
MPAQDESDEIGDRLGVDGAERLVEQNDRRILQQQPREEHALELPARQRTDRAIAKILEADCGERLGDMRLARAIESAPGADLAPQSHRHAVEHGDGKAAVYLDLLGKIGHVAFLETVEIETAAKRL